MDGLTIQQLACFDAVVSAGGFQAAAERLKRAHPSVYAAVKNLEAQVGVRLLDRTGYRVRLTAGVRPQTSAPYSSITTMYLAELRSPYGGAYG